MKRTLIHNAILVNEGKQVAGSVVMENGRIVEILTHENLPTIPCEEIIDATGCYLLPGVIDEHVHFREPGMTHKANILTESRAAAAGGVTSIMDMPNTMPQTTTIEALEKKFNLLNENCIVNHSCYFGATNSNFTEFAKLDRHRVCGIKLFMGSSTGDMLVNQPNVLQRIFCNTDLLIATHCEDQAIIRANTEKYKSRYKSGEIPLKEHPHIRSSKACYVSSALAVHLAKKSGARLHLLHISTAKELNLLTAGRAIDKQITAETCIAYLLFSMADYWKYGTRIKCNPAIKRHSDREALRQALHLDIIDSISTDHAPHLLEEKRGGALQARSGMPFIQFSLPAMLELVDQKVLSLEDLVRKMCHAPAEIYCIRERGFIRLGYYADLVLVRPQSPWRVTADKILSKCGWSPLEGYQLGWKVEKTFINGQLVFDGEQVNENYRGEELKFE